MLLSIYWKVLLNADLRLLAAAALLPGGGCLIAYIVAKIICFVSNNLSQDCSYGGNTLNVFHVTCPFSSEYANICLSHCISVTL